MEALVVLISIVIGLAILLSPITSWLALSRGRRLEKELKDLQAHVKALQSDLTQVRKEGQRQAQRLAGVESERPSAQSTFVETSPNEDSEPVEPVQTETVASDIPSVSLPALTEPSGESPPDEEISGPVVEVPQPVLAEKSAAGTQDAVFVSDLPGVSDADEEAPSGSPEPEVQDFPAEAEPLSDEKAHGPIEEPAAARKVWPDQGPRTRRMGSRLGGLAARLFGSRDRSKRDWEAIVGQQWLNVLGIVVLVVGIVLLIQQTILLVPAVGKVALGAGASLLLMVSGGYLRRKDQYRGIALSLVGGGWGLLYFTAFAAHNIDAARIIQNEYLAMIVLFLVAAGIVGQSFSYRNEAVTGLAYGLAYLALHLSPLNFYSLVATAVLTASVPFVVRRMDWRRLGLVLVVATYATHARWLWATSLASTPEDATLILGSLTTTTVFWGNIGILAVYWILYSLTAIAHPPEKRESRSIDMAVSVLNMVGSLGLIAWQFETYLPGKLHYVAPPALLAYVAISIVDFRMVRPVLSNLNGTIAVVLATLAMPLAIHFEGWSWDWLAPYWTLVGLIVWIIAERLANPLYRAHGYALAAFAVAAASGVNLDPGAATIQLETVILGLTPLLLVVWIMEAQGRKAFEMTGPDRGIFQVAIFAVPLIVCLALWAAMSDRLAGLSMLATAVALFEASGALNRSYLRWQAYLTAFVGITLILTFDIADASAEQYGQTRGVLVAAAVLAYFLSLRMRRSQAGLFSGETLLSWSPAAGATVFVTAAIFQWLDFDQVPFGWAIWALVLTEAGQRLKWAEVRFQSYALLCLAVAAALAQVTHLIGAAQEPPAWQWTVAVAALLHVATARMVFPSVPLWVAEDRFAGVPLVAGIVTAMAGFWEITPAYLIAATWVFWALVLYEAGQKISRADIADIALVTAMVAFAAALLINVYGMFAPGALSAPLNGVCVVGVASVLYLLQYRQRRGMRFAARIIPDVGWALHLGSILIALAIWREFPSVAVAVGWAGMAFVAIELSLRYGHKPFFRQAQVLVLAAVVRLFFANFTVPSEGFGMSHRLISVGVVIALVYYVRALMNVGWGKDMRLIPGSAFSWIAAGLLVVLARFEVGREYAAAVWSVLILIFMYLGMKLPDRGFRYQAYVIALLVFARVWSTNVYLEGTLWGISERIALSLPSLGALLIAVILTPPGFGAAAGIATRGRIERALSWADQRSRPVLSMLFATQLTLLVFYQISIDLVSIGWAVSALFLLALGFVLNERSLRLFGLALLFVCLLKVVFIDLEGVETIYRIFSFIVLGLVLLLVSMGYSRFRSVLGKYF